MHAVVGTGSPAVQAGADSVTCPACGGHNPADAVFCAIPDCCKAPGEFRYVAEELHDADSFVQRLADTTNRLAGWPHFSTLHVLWFAVWFVLNTGLLSVFGVFDAYPYDLLGLVLGVEAALLASLLLISNNRQNEYNDKRAELDYEVTVRTWRRVMQLEYPLQELCDRLDGNGGRT